MNRTNENRNFRCVSLNEIKKPSFLNLLRKREEFFNVDTLAERNRKSQFNWWILCSSKLTIEDANGRNQFI